MPLYGLSSNFRISAGSNEKIGLFEYKKIQKEFTRRTQRGKDAKNAKEMILLYSPANSARSHFSLREKKE